MTKWIDSSWNYKNEKENIESIEFVFDNVSSVSVNPKLVVDLVFFNIDQYEVEINDVIETYFYSDMNIKLDKMELNNVENYDFSKMFYGTLEEVLEHLNYGDDIVSIEIHNKNGDVLEMYSNYDDSYNGSLNSNVKIYDDDEKFLEIIITDIEYLMLDFERFNRKARELYVGDWVLSYENGELRTTFIDYENIKIFSSTYFWYNNDCELLAPFDGKTTLDRLKVFNYKLTTDPYFRKKLGDGFDEWAKKIGVDYDI